MRAHAWYENEEAAARSLSETLKFMLGKEWTEEEKGGLEGAFLEAARREGGYFVRGEGGKVGFPMVAFAAVARK